MKKASHVRRTERLFLGTIFPQVFVEEGAGQNRRHLERLYNLTPCYSYELKGKPYCIYPPATLVGEMTFRSSSHDRILFMCVLLFLKWDF